MKIGVISDTHIPEKSEHIPNAVLEAFKNVDMIIHAGDLVNLKAIEELQSVCPNVIAVCGNMDNADVTKKYPLKQVFQVQGFKIGLMHGYGAPLNLVAILKDAFKADNCDIIIFGHSHKAMNEKIGKTLFFNPGSATDFIYSDASYGIIEIDKEINAKIINL